MVCRPFPQNGFGDGGIDVGRQMRHVVWLDRLRLGFRRDNDAQPREYGPNVHAVDLIGATRPNRPTPPIPPPSQRRSIARRAVSDASGATRSRGPDRIRPNFVGLPPWMHPPKYHPGVTLTAVNQVVQESAWATMILMTAAGFRLLPVVPAVDGAAPRQTSESFGGDRHARLRPSSSARAMPIRPIRHLPARGGGRDRPRNTGKDAHQTGRVDRLAPPCRQARRVCRNVKRWRSASMAMRWTAAAMQEAAKGFRRLKAHKQLPALRAALEANQNKNSHGVLARQANAA